MRCKELINDDKGRRLLIGLLFCFQQFAGGLVGVWGFLVFLRMAVAGLIVGWHRSLPEVDIRLLVKELGGAPGLEGLLIWR